MASSESIRGTCSTAYHPASTFGTEHDGNAAASAKSRSKFAAHAFKYLIPNRCACLHQIAPAAACTGVDTDK